MEGSYKAHNLQKNSKRTNNKDKQITSVNPEKPDEKDEFKVAFWTEEAKVCYGGCLEANSKRPEQQNERSVHRPT